MPDTTRVEHRPSVASDTLPRDSASLAADTVTVPPREFTAPNAPGDSTSQALDRLWETPVWPMPPPADLAAGDLSDWLTYLPTIDVADAPGPGQFRRYTRWGLVDRVGDWMIDQRSFGWQRLTIPQSATFDPGVVPSFEFSEIKAGDNVDLRRTSDWPLQAQSSYFLRQGDYGETYSQGNFRHRFPRAYAIDFDFLFYSNKGRQTGVTARTRNLRLQLVGPLRGRVFWAFEFNQYTDKSGILTDIDFTALQPHRDDLMYSLDWSVYHAQDSSFLRAGGLRLQSGKHDIRTSIGYDPSGATRQISWLESHDRVWTVWAEGATHGWYLNAKGMLEHLRLRPIDHSRWGASLDGSKLWPVGTWGSGSLHLTLDGWDNDPLAASVAIAITADRGNRALVPTIKLERTRFVPTLFDRDRPLAEIGVSSAGGSGSEVYSEEGDPGLKAEWRNSAAFVLQTPVDSAHARFEFVSEARVTYVQRYIRWEDVSNSPTSIFYRPASSDARTVGIAAAIRSHLFSKFHLWVNYAAKYAETLRHERLPGYYPQKGSAIISWIAPQIRYKIDLRLNAAFLWWYGDARILPTGYNTANIFRVDLSGSATMKDFTFYYSVQNVAGFAYRSAAGYPFTGRTVRFGLNWNFLN